MSVIAPKYPRMDFDPNVKEQYASFATYCPYRNPNFKAHARRRDALSAITSHKRGILYRHDGAKWVEEFRVEDWTELKREDCSICGADVMRPAYNGVMQNHGHAKWLTHPDGSIRLIWVCYGCWRLKDKSINPNVVQWGDGE